MKRREFIAGLGGAVATWPVVAQAQIERVRRVGVLVALGEQSTEGQSYMQAFRDGLVKLGWVVGRNLHVDYRWGGADPDVLRKSAAELVALRPDVLLAGTTSALIALRSITNTFPIIFAQVSDPVARGYISSLAHPGGNVTGFALHEHGIGTKWVELLRELVPSAKRVVVMLNLANSGQTYLPEIQKAAADLKVVSYPIRNKSDIDDVIAQAGSEPNTVLVALSGPATAFYCEHIVAVAIKHRLPLVHPYRYYAVAGALMTYGPDVGEQYRAASSYIDRVLKGEKPADLPVQLPTRYSFVLNTKTANALGLTVPPMLLARADEVIE